VKFKRNTLKASDEIVVSAIITPLQALSLNMPQELKLIAEVHNWHTKRPQTLITVTKNAL
jgi:hypothetical protein